MSGSKQLRRAIDLARLSKPQAGRPVPRELHPLDRRSQVGANARWPNGTQGISKVWLDFYR
jgi:hypothetical protein